VELGGLVSIVNKETSQKLSLYCVDEQSEEIKLEVGLFSAKNGNFYLF